LRISTTSTNCCLSDRSSSVSTPTGLPWKKRTSGCGREIVTRLLREFGEPDPAGRPNISGRPVVRKETDSDGALEKA
jgi:hypothetical protein